MGHILNQQVLVGVISQETKLHQIKELQLKHMSSSEFEKMFLTRCSLPSILGFSLILIYYGGKRMIKSLLSQLCKGGISFYKQNVVHGQLFRHEVIDSCHLQLDMIEIGNQSDLLIATNKIFLDGVSIDYHIRSYWHTHD